MRTTILFALSRALTVLHVSPHPDDEALGAPATLVRMTAAGHRVVNVACSLGRMSQHERRRREVEEACRRLKIDLVILDPPARITANDDLGAAERLLDAEFSKLIHTHQADVVVSPSPHDVHHGHEVVARAVLSACARAGVRLWMWSLWGDLVWPTMFVPFDEQILAVALDGLRAHEGELARNNYEELLAARGITNSVLGAERVFGFGSAARSAPFAEVLLETISRGGTWWAGLPRELDPRSPLAPIPTDRPITTLLSRVSAADVLRSASS